MSLALTSVISSCTEDDISVVDCNGIPGTKPVDDIKKCINGKWKVIGYYNLDNVLEYEDENRYIEFYQSDSLSWIYADSSRYTYSFEWIVFENPLLKEEINLIKIHRYDSEYELLIFFKEHTSDTLSIHEQYFPLRGVTSVLVRSNDK